MPSNAPVTSVKFPPKADSGKKATSSKDGKGECCQKVRIFIDTCYWKGRKGAKGQPDGPVTVGPDDGQPDGPRTSGPDDGQPDSAGTSTGRTTFLKIGDVGITVRVFP